MRTLISRWYMMTDRWGEGSGTGITALYSSCHRNALLVCCFLAAEHGKTEALGAFHDHCEHISSYMYTCICMRRPMHAYACHCLRCTARKLPGGTLLSAKLVRPTCRYNFRSGGSRGGGGGGGGGGHRGHVPPPPPPPPPPFRTTH